MNAGQVMDIGEVAAQSGLRASTLRYYEEIGLIRSVGRNGLRRLFDADVMERLGFIALGQRVGFSLQDIAGMFASDGSLAVDRDQLREKADELDKMIKDLSAMREGLRHASVCGAPSHMECPKFQRLLGLAGKARKRTLRQGKK